MWLETMITWSTNKTYNNNKTIAHGVAWPLGFWCGWPWSYKWPVCIFDFHTTDTVPVYTYINITWCPISELISEFSASVQQLVWTSRCCYTFVWTRGSTKPVIQNFLNLQDPWWRKYARIMQVEQAIVHYLTEFCFFTFYQPSPVPNNSLI